MDFPIEDELLEYSESEVEEEINSSEAAEILER